MIRGNSALRVRRGLRAWLFAAFAALPITAVLAATQYLYDDLGRLVLVANSDGSAAVYAHDENGNVLSITQWAASGPVIAAFSPMYGHADTTVTILGTGFSATPANNTVTIGGVAAAVSTATATTLVSSVPQGANTGPITVTVGGVTAVSAQTFTVYKPLIVSFSPSLVAPGGSVTVTGANLNLVSGGTSLSVGGTGVTVTSLSNNQAVFTAPGNTGGAITVNTSYGQATSATSLVIVPNAVGVANVVDHDPADPNGPSQSLAINQQNKTALLSFQAAANSFYSVQLDALTLTPSGGYIGYTVYGPTGASFTWGNVSSTAPSIHLPKTTAAGRYLVAFNSGSKTSVQITARVELNTALTADATTLPFSTTAVYQSRRFTFSATAGDDLGLAITSLVLTPSSPTYARLWLTTPAGNWVLSGEYCYATSVPGCSFNLMNLPETGVYQFTLEALGASTMSFGLTLSAHATGTLTAGTPQPVTVMAPGRKALLTFTATAGQAAALHYSSISTTPVGKPVTMLVYNPSGSVVSSLGVTTQATVNLTNLVAGTYSVVVSPNDAATGSATVTLASGLTGTLPANGTTQSFATTVPQQTGYFTFSATAGDDLGLAITNLVLTPSSPNYVRLWLTTPAGNWVLGGEICSVSSVPGCSFNLMNVPETGVYRFTMEAMGQSTMSFDLTLSAHATGTLTAGTPQPVTLTVPGRKALLTFTATGGEAAALHVSSVSTTPAGKSVTTYVYNPSGSAVAQFSTTTQATVNLTNLVAGTYSVVVSPNDAATGSATITLANGLTASLPANSTTQSFATTVPQQHGYFTFSATAGDDLGLAITNLVLTPSSPNYVRLFLTTPAGNWVLGGENCALSLVPGCSFNLMNLPETGVYRFTMEAMGQSTMSFDLTLSAHATGTLTAGTPYPVTLSQPGKMALLTFTATAGQAAALHVSSVGTTPAGKSVTMYVYNPSGSAISSLGTTTQATLNLTNLVAGTYAVAVVPSNAATGSATVTLANGLTASLPANGTTQSFATTVPQQHGYFTFSATAGDDLGLAITNLVLTPSSPNYVRLYLTTPAGNWVLGGENCSVTSVPGCSFNLLNLPETGVYRFTMESMGQSTMSFDLTLSSDVTGALTFGTPLDVTLDSPGERAWLSFTATAGQNVVLTKSSIVTTPSGKAIWTMVYNPSGGLIANTSNNTINLNNLSAGTYQVLLWGADAATATLQVGVQ